MGHQLASAQLEAIKRFDTCSLSNAIEEFGLRLRNEGYTKPGLRCIFPELDPMLGYAVTSRIKTSDPPVTGAYHLDRNDWWELMLKGPAPHVAVIQDIDPNPGIGASIGEVHASILQALQCAGVVTDGAVRDLAPVRAIQFPMFAHHVSVSHAYVHMVDFGSPVEISGLKIHSGDLLYGDCHGVLSIPHEIAGEVASKAEELLKKERKVIDLCRSPEFSIQKLRLVLKDFQ